MNIHSGLQQSNRSTSPCHDSRSHLILVASTQLISHGGGAHSGEAILQLDARRPEQPGEDRWGTQ